MNDGTYLIKNLLKHTGDLHVRHSFGHKAIERFGARLRDNWPVMSEGPLTWWFDKEKVEAGNLRLMLREETGKPVPNYIIVAMLAIMLHYRQESDV